MLGLVTAETSIYSIFWVQISMEQRFIPTLLSMWKSTSQRGITAELRDGFNHALPFPDNSMDFLISWNSC